MGACKPSDGLTSSRRFLIIGVNSARENRDVFWVVLNLMYTMLCSIKCINLMYKLLKKILNIGSDFPNKNMF